MPSTIRGFASGESRTVLVWHTAQLRKVRSTPSPDGGGASDLLHTSNLGIEDSRAGGIAVTGGTAYVTGTTNSDNFPTQAPLQATRRSLANVDDAFVTKLNASGSA